MTSTAIPSPKGETLKPCPWCDNAERVRLCIRFWSYVTCDACAAYGPAKPTPAEAIAVWNRRSPSSSEDVRREALEEAAKVAEQLAGELVRLKGSGDRRVQIGSHLETCATIAASIRALSQKE